MLSYLVASSGIMASMHYCGNNLASVSFGAKVTNACGCGSENIKKACCHDKAFYLHLDDNQQKSTESSFEYAKSFNVDLDLHTVFHLPVFKRSLAVTRNYTFHHPPVKIPLYVLHRVFRI